MHISETTYKLISNFSRISNSLIMKEENSLISIANAGNIIGVCEIEETFPEFGIYNLREFLGAIKLLGVTESEFDFKDKFVKIKRGRNSIKYIFTDPTLLMNYDKIKPRENYIKHDDFQAHFTMTDSEIKRLRRAASLIFPSSAMDTGSSTNINIFIKNGVGSITLDAPDDPTANTFKIDIEAAEGSSELNINVDNLILYPGDYDISITNQKKARFKHSELPLLYFINARII